MLLGTDGSEYLVGFLIMKKLEAKPVLVVRAAGKAVIAGEIGEHVFNFLYHQSPSATFATAATSSSVSRFMTFTPWVLRPVLRISETFVLIILPP